MQTTPTFAGKGAQRNNDIGIRPRGLAVNRRLGEIVLFNRDKLLLLTAALLESTTNLARVQLSFPGTPEPVVIAVVRLGGKFELLVEIAAGIHITPGPRQVVVGEGPTGCKITVIGGDHEYCVLQLDIPGIGDPIVIGIVPSRGHVKMIISAKREIEITRPEAVE